MTLMSESRNCSVGWQWMFSLVVKSYLDMKLYSVGVLNRSEEEQVPICSMFQI